MLGLVYLCFQNFVTQTYGAACWQDILRRAGIEFSGFEALLTYDAELAQPLVTAAAVRLGKTRDAVLEDAGTFLVTHPSMESLRRLLRFGGSNFVEFLHSLDDLPERVRLALPDLELPGLQTQVFAEDQFHVVATGPHDFFGPVLVGLIRAMADDFGALTMVESVIRHGQNDTIVVTVADFDFSHGRSFDLSAGVRDRRKVVS